MRNKLRKVITVHRCLHRHIHVYAAVAHRVVTWEILGRKFPEIYSNLSGNLLKNFSFYTF